jgi:hypothetical protein
MKFATPMPLADFVKTFTDSEVKDEDKKIQLPYEAFNINNYDEVLSQTVPFTKKDFFDSRTQKTISDADYETYLREWKTFENEKCSITRWDYLLHYNERDVLIMIKPISYLIKFWANYYVNMLENVSAPGCATTAKFRFFVQSFGVGQVL